MKTARISGLPYRVRLLTATVTSCLALGLLAPTAQGAAAPLPAPAPAAIPAPAKAPDADAPQPASVPAPETREADHASGRVPASQRPPVLPVKDPATAASLSATARARTAAACNVADFTTRTGSALVQLVKASEPGCVDDLFQLTGSDARGAFREAQMVTVADALRANSAAYPGDNGTSTYQLVLFLRAGYYVQWYNSSDVGSYGPALTAAIRGALDGYFGSARSRDVTAANAGILGESVILIDSAQENARYIPVVKRLLTDYDAATYNAVAGMPPAVNNVNTVLFRGHQADGFLAAVQADPSLLDTLAAFTSRNKALLGGTYSYLPYNTARELGRFLQHPGLRSKLQPLMRGLADQSAPSGNTAYLLAALAEMVDAYDPSRAADYGTANAAARLRAGILVTSHSCSPSIRVLAQQVTAANLTAICDSLIKQDAYFHSVARDLGPVADDHNTAIEVVVFDRSYDYQVFAAAIYGINTDNGGMYLEGDPAQPGNLPRFLAYEDTRVLPDFQVWNLNHEYTHYLDGRFNMHGDFTAGVSTPTIWWIEGFAEYVSYSYRNLSYDAAIAAAGLHTYKLSTLFDTTYENTNTERTYRWGYLAVRYMLEKHRADLDAVLAKYRAGDWNGARTLLKTTIGTRYDADFDAWLTACAAGACATTPQPGNQAPTASFEATVSGMTASFTDTSRDSDGSIASRSWDFGDGTTSTAATPSRTYTAAGTYTVKLTVTDDKGATATTSRTVAVSVLPGCPDPDVRRLDRDCTRGNVSATTGNYAYHYLYVPAGTPRLTITTTGADGNADLYYNASSWATTGAYTARSTRTGSAEALTVDNPPTGWVYISLHAQQGFTGASVTVRY
ncbi:collagenase [Streptomyces sp. NPDC058486]|uniref:collagenase n=1 Tax=unclassified Streptomyces TaxID=2593676 RepID=UPI0036661A26